VGAAQMEQPWVLRSESGVRGPLGLENPLFGIQPSLFSPSSPHGPAVRAMSFASLLGRTKSVWLNDQPWNSFHSFSVSPGPLTLPPRVAPFSGVPAYLDRLGLHPGNPVPEVTP
jgi:hypothetical protein